MLVGYNTFGYCGFNTDDNSIVAGQIVLDMEKGELRKNGQNLVIFMIDPIDVFSCFGAGPKIVVIIKRKFNDIGSIYELVRDHLFDKLVSLPRADTVLFPKVPNLFVAPKLRCSSKYYFDNMTFEGICYLYNNGVQSYSSKIILSNNRTTTTKSYLLGTMTNVQGFSSRVSSINAEYIVLIAEKKSQTEIAENNLILVYKLSEEYHMPFLIFTPQMLEIPDEAFKSMDAGISIG